MLAVDTNIAVRFLMQDDELQTKRATSLFSRQLVWISKTVLLETSWVLESVYKLRPQQAAVILRAMTGLPNVRVEESLNVAKAFEWTESGIGFADALHLASMDGSAKFVTFDLKFAKRARKLTGVQIAAL